MKKNYIYILITIIIIYIVSLSLLNSYTKGDQTSYRIYYERINGAKMYEIQEIARTTIGSYEPFSWILFWAASNLNIEKNVFVSFLNIILLLGIILFLQKYQPAWYIYPLFITNFYVVVMMTSAERLKVAYIILILSFYVKSKWKYIMLLLSPFAHLQSIIFIITTYISSISTQLKKIITNKTITKRIASISFILIFLFLGIVTLLQDGIVNKYNSYSTDRLRITELINIFILLSISLYVIRDKFLVIITSIPLIIAILLVGGQRVNMIAVTIYLGLFVINRKTSHPLVLLLLFYFSLKTIPFVQNIYTLNDGFAGPLW